MNKHYLSIGTLLVYLSCVSVWAASDVAPAVPDLSLPVENEVVVEPEQNVMRTNPAVRPATIRKTAKKNNNISPKKTQKPEPVEDDSSVISVSNAKINGSDETYEEMHPTLDMLPPELGIPAPSAAPVEEQTAEPAEEDNQPDVVDPTTAPARPKKNKSAAKKSPKVIYNPPSRRDPTLSPDDVLLLKHREEERLRAIEAEKKRKLEAEQRRLAELERQRQLELERLRDPSREIRGKIRVNGIIGQEAFIGNKVYTVGKSVLGAQIISIQPDSVVFIYKGQKFTKKVQLQ